MAGGGEGREGSRPDHRGLLRSALETIERLQSKLDAVESARREPIAVIGMSCRFPGGANSPEDYWKLLRERRDAIQELPAGRWSQEAYLQLDPEVGSTMPRQFGGLIDGIDRFDSGLFGIAPREVATMDPQQRLLLEVGWEAIERAGYAPDRLGGSLTGVFIGISGLDYAKVVREADPGRLDVYFATGNALSVAAGRISYLLGLRGPAISVDTACSSSLTAVHLACLSLRQGECDMALAGGVNAILTPDTFICLATSGMMAPDGRCKAFDAAADGFVRAEGCGVVVLKRLSQAIADRDPVLAVIRGSSANEDGASGGLTVPNGIAQQAVITQALANSALSGADIDYVEAHGTGTPLGDPIELEAIDAALGDGRPADKPVFVGSVKSNMGHLESAAGVAGLMKAILALQKREIPANLHFHQLNPRISLKRLKLIVPVESIPWPADNKPRRAGVSSFGISGTNVHAVVEEAPPLEHTRDATAARLPVLTLSAKKESTLRSLVGRYKEYLSDGLEASLADACFTSNVGRSHFSHRIAVVASSPKEAVDLLAAVDNGAAAGVYRGISNGAAQSKVAFLFTGGGAQYIGMGRGLYAAEPAFRDAIERCDGILRSHMDRSLMSVLYPEDGSPSPIDEAVYFHPALFAFEYAMSELWRSWGVVPDLMLGHSLGEYAAACTAGVVSLEDALKLVAARGRLMQALPRGGAMAAVYASEDQVEHALSPCRDRVSIAALNGPLNVVISGEESCVSSVLAELARLGIEAKRLSVSHASHSPLVEPMLDAFERVAEQVNYSLPDCPIVSSVTGELVDPAQIATAAYWRRHLRASVRFADGVATAARAVQCFIELGPTATLLGLARECLPESSHALIPSCRRSVEDCRQIAEALAMSYAAGVKIDWDSLHRSHPRRRVLLPTYPFERARHWIRSRAGSPRPLSRSIGGETLHPLFDVHIVLAHEPDTHVFEGEVGLERLPFLTDHRVQGRAVFPAAGYAEMALAAKRAAFGRSPVALENVEYESPILLDEGKRVRTQVRLEKDREGGFKFAIFSRIVQEGAAKGAGAPWIPNASGRIRSIEAPAESKMGVDEFERIKARCRQEVDGAEFYRKLAERGNQWGPTFQGLERVWRGDREVLARISVPDAVRAEMEHYEWHPAVADSCGHPLSGTIPLERIEGPRGGALVGGRIDESRVYTPLRGHCFWVHARLRDDDSESSNVLVGDLRILDDSLNFLSELRGARLWYLDESAPQMRAGDWIYSVQFEPVEDAAAAVDSATGIRRWLILTDEQGVGEALGRALVAQGDRVDFLHRQREDAPPGYGAAGRRVVPEDLRTALAGRSKADGGYHGIVHLWSLDGRMSDEATARDAQTALAVGAESALLCMKELATCSEPMPPRLWLVSRGAQTIGDGDAPADPAHTAVWGLARTFAAEYPSMWGGIVDLPDRPTAEQPVALLAEIIRRPGREDQFALRDNRLLAARLVRVRLSPFARRFECRPDVCYVITGGLGGLGLGLAAWLVRQGARHLALLGRTALPPREEWDSFDEQTRAGRRVAAVRHLEAMGARVWVGHVDVGSEDSLAACLAGLLPAGWPEVGGVIHAAAVLGYQSLRDATVENFRDTLHAKALGGWLLHKWAARKRIDCFVLFSSAAAILNSPFLGAYAAANAFLDGLAQRRAAQGVSAHSIDWGLWGDIGMATEAPPEEVQMAQARGMGSIPADLGFEIFGMLVQQENPQVCVLPVDWGKWKQLFPAFVGTPFFGQAIGAPPEEYPVDRPDTRAAIRAASGVERHRLIREAVRRTIANVLGLPESDLEEGVSMSRLGLDSLMAIELRNRLVADIGSSLPLVRLLEGPSVAQLVELLEAELNTAALGTAAETPAEPSGSGQTSGAIAAREAGRVLDKLDDLSEEQVDTLLKEMLGDRETTS